MIFIELYDYFEVPNCCIVLVELVEYFGETKVTRNTFGLKFYAVTKVLFSFLKAPLVCKGCCEVNSCPKMLVILQKYLLKMIDG